MKVTDFIFLSSLTALPLSDAFAPVPFALSKHQCPAPKVATTLFASDGYDSMTMEALIKEVNNQGYDHQGMDRTALIMIAKGWGSTVRGAKRLGNGYDYDDGYGYGNNNSARHMRSGRNGPGMSWSEETDYRQDNRMRSRNGVSTRDNRYSNSRGSGYGQWSASRGGRNSQDRFEWENEPARRRSEMNTRRMAQQEFNRYQEEENMRMQNREKYKRESIPDYDRMSLEQLKKVCIEKGYDASRITDRTELIMICRGYGANVKRAIPLFNNGYQQQDQRYNSQNRRGYQQYDQGYQQYDQRYPRQNQRSMQNNQRYQQYDQNYYPQQNQRYRAQNQRSMQQNQRYYQDDQRYQTGSKRSMNQNQRAMQDQRYQQDDRRYNQNQRGYNQNDRRYQQSGRGNQRYLQWEEVDSVRRSQRYDNTRSTRASHGFNDGRLQVTTESSSSSMPDYDKMPMDQLKKIVNERGYDHQGVDRTGMIMIAKGMGRHVRGARSLQDRLNWEDYAARSQTERVERAQYEAEEQRYRQRQRREDTLRQARYEHDMSRSREDEYRRANYGQRQGNYAQNNYRQGNYYGRGQSAGGLVPYNNDRIGMSDRNPNSAY
jgi:hypothetical protein